MKKKYERPLITNPESGDRGFIPLGATGCVSGGVGSACASGTEPQATRCGVGSSPTLLNCVTGSSAGNNCGTGADAITSCDVGVSVQADCTRGSTPLGPTCGKGSSASTCAAGGGGGA